jgi:peptidoglycan/xylan/chitin deacetylase (PgdA/CDA1 family)
MYHRFSGARTADPRFIDRALLQRHAALIARHHPRWSPEDQLEALANGRKPSACPVVVTVDDGYSDFFDVAFPVFREYRIPAMLFVVSGFVSGSQWLWWDQLEFMLEGAPTGEIALNVAGSALRFDLRAPENRRKAWHAIADRCRFLPHRDVLALLADVQQTLGRASTGQPPARYRAVTWDQIRAMAGEGMRFGAHTVTHPILTRLPLDEAAREIADSKASLERELAQPARVFCYPQGGPADVSDDVRRQVESAGFRGAYLAYPGLDPAGDRFRLPRYVVTHDWVDFRWTLCGAEHLVTKLRHRLGIPASSVGDFYWAGAPESDSR